MKEKLSHCLFITLRILASAWLSFLVSIVPLYIWRGTHPNNKTGEHLILSLIGLLFGFLFLMFLQMRDDNSHRFGMRDTLFTAAGGIGLYLLLWIIVYLPTKNNFIIAVLGHSLSCLIRSGADGRPTFPAALASALLFGAVYFLAILTGTKIAHKRHSRFLESMKKDG